jgi:hypothetical protein
MQVESRKLGIDRPSIIQKHQRGRSRSLAWACAFAVCLSICSSMQAKAQTLYGSLVGTVTDNTGAAVPDASVVITETQTNDTRTVVSDNGGVYTVSTIPPGSPSRASRASRPVVLMSPRIT